MNSDRPSSTALMVALSVLREGRRHRLPPLCQRLAAEALQQASLGWRSLSSLARHGAGRLALALLERLVLPGLARHHCQRKQWILQRLTACPQPWRWLWLGAGFDALGLVLRQREARIDLLELDHPASLAHRQRLPAWREHSKTAPLPLLMPRDAGQLVAFCAQAPRSVIAEGVPMYLPGRPLLRLLRRLARLPQPPRLLFSALQPCAASGGGFRQPGGLTRRWLHARGEPFLWRAEATRLQRLLGRHGYRVEACWRGEALGEYVIDASPAARTDQD